MQISWFLQKSYSQEKKKKTDDALFVVKMSNKAGTI